MRLLMSLMLLATAGTASAFAQDERPYLGITLIEDDDEATPSTQIESVRPDSAAANAGLQAGDVLMALGDRRFRDVDGLLEALDACEVGQVVGIVYRRGEDMARGRLKLGARPTEEWTDAEEEVVEEIEAVEEDAAEAIDEVLEPQDEDARVPGYLGVSLAETDAGGALVTEVREGTAAARGGLQAGDRIFVAGDREIGTAMDLVDAISGRSAGDVVQLRYRREGSDDLRRMRVRLGARPAVEAEDMPEVEPPTERRAVPELRRPVERADERPDERPAYLGVTIADTDRGAVVDEVVEDSAAARAGLRPGDHIHSLGDRKVGSLDDLVEALAGHHAGDVVTLSYGRADSDRILRTRARLGARPGEDATEAHEHDEGEHHEHAEGEAHDHTHEHGDHEHEHGDHDHAHDDRPAYLGVTLAESDRGVVIDQVLEGTAAARSGLRSGDVIRALNGREIGSAQGLADAIAEHHAGDGAVLSLRRGDERMQTELRFGARPEEGGMILEEGLSDRDVERLQADLDERRALVEQMMQERRQAEEARRRATQQESAEAQAAGRGADERTLQMLERLMHRVEELQEQVRRQGEALERMQQQLNRERSGGGEAPAGGLRIRRSGDG